MNYPPPVYYDNILNKNNKGKRIMDMDKLYKGQIYVLDMHGDIRCGPLINKELSDLKERTNYFGMYFCIGTAKYDGINMKDQVHQYHLQSHLNLPAMQLEIYEYHLTGDLEAQIKNFWYYKKTVYNLCRELNINEDIEKWIKLFL